MRAVLAKRGAKRRSPGAFQLAHMLLLAMTRLLPQMQAHRYSGCAPPRPFLVTSSGFFRGSLLPLPSLLNSSTNLILSVVFLSPNGKIALCWRSGLGLGWLFWYRLSVSPFLCLTRFVLMANGYLVMRTVPLTHLGPLGPTIRYGRTHISRMSRKKYLRLCYLCRSPNFKRGDISLFLTGVKPSGTHLVPEYESRYHELMRDMTLTYYRFTRHRH